MTDQPPYTPFSTFLATHFGARRVQKLPVNAGFTCPVRDGKISFSGCGFCNGRSFVPSYCEVGDDISLQLEKGKNFFARKYRSAESPVYLAYFQSATNTYAAVHSLREKYERALSVEGVGGLVVSTRPDCIDEEVAGLLGEISKRAFVMVELGCESFDDDVLESVGRGHKVAHTLSAVEMLKTYGLPVSVHLIFGLPEEKPNYVVRNAEMLNLLAVNAVKLHQLQIVRGSRFSGEYAQNPSYFKLYSVEDYVNDVCLFLEHLSPSIAIDRFVSEMPAADLVAPKWGLKPDAILLLIKEEMQRRHSFQGKRIILA